MPGHPSSSVRGSHVAGPRAQTLGTPAMFRHTYANVGCIVLEVNIDLAFTFHQYLPLTSTKLRASLGHVLTEPSACSGTRQDRAAGGATGPLAGKRPPVPLLVSWAGVPRGREVPSLPACCLVRRTAWPATLDQWRQNLETKTVFALGRTEAQWPDSSQRCQQADFLGKLGKRLDDHHIGPRR